MDRNDPYRHIITVSDLIDGEVFFVSGGVSVAQRFTQYRIVTLVCGHTLQRPPDTHLRVGDAQYCFPCCREQFDTLSKGYEEAKENARLAHAKLEQL